MKNRLGVIFAVVTAVSALASSRPLFAHHSSSSYDMDHPLVLKGVITNVEWTNPHVFIFLNVKDDAGAVMEWRVEGNSPNMLTRVGWKKELLVNGDSVTVNGAPARDGAKVMRLINLTLASGQKLDGQGFK